VLFGAAPSHEACVEDQCYALVALQRSALAERVANARGAARAQFDAMLARVPEADLLSALALLARARRLSPLLDADETLLAALSAAHAPRSFAAEVARARSQRLSGVKACLQASPSGVPAPARVFAPATLLLGEQGLDGIVLGPGCASGNLTIDYAASSELPEPSPSSTEAELWTISYVGRVRVSTADGALSREREVAGRGVSRSIEVARRDAEDRLAEAVRNAVAELLLGEQA
jgi:hypothetical protein